MGELGFERQVRPGADVNETTKRFWRTRDDTGPGIEYHAGKIQTKTLRADPMSSGLFRAIGSKKGAGKVLSIQRIPLGARAGATQQRAPNGARRFLIASDGLSKARTADIEAILASEPEPDVAAEKLRQLARDAGSTDEVTIQVVDVFDEALGS